MIHAGHVMGHRIGLGYLERGQRKGGRQTGKGGKAA